MVKMLCGGTMLLVDALTCAYTLADAASPSMVYGTIALSVLGAIPFVATCADGWFNSLGGLSSAQDDAPR